MLDVAIKILRSFDEIENYIESGKSEFVKHLNIQVKADWVEGRNPGYKAVKLVTSGLKLAM